MPRYLIELRGAITLLPRLFSTLNYLSSQSDWKVVSNMSKAVDGQKIAALRVKQRQRRESLRWSPSGKLRPRSSRAKAANSPSAALSSVPWNDRFIFDDDSHQRGRSIPTKKVSAEKDSTGRIRSYTERCDDEAVGSFQQIEVSSSIESSLEIQQVETRRVALSPIVKVSPDEADTPKVKLFDATEAKNILDRFEALLLTMQIEEELLRRDLDLTTM